MKIKTYRKLNLQYFGGSGCQNHDTDSDKLVELKYDDLRECNCKRCAPVADSKELDSLRQWKEEDDVRKAAVEEGKRLAQEILETGQQVDEELKGIVGEVVREELEKKGRKLTSPTRSLIEQKMQFSKSSGPYVNTQHGRNQVSPQMKSFIHWAKTGEVTDRKALAGGTPSAGGYLVPEEFRAEVIRKMKPLTVMRRAGARAFDIGSDNVTIPTVASDGQGGWTGENAAYTESEPTFGEVKLAPNKYTRLVKASYEMLEDSALNVADLLSDIFAEDFAAAEDAAFINGDGAGKPTGILQASITTVAADNAALGDSLIRTIYALPRQYRNGAVWMMSNQAIQEVRLLKDSNGNYLWQPGIQADEPPRLLGYPVYESNDIPEYDIDGAGAGTDMGSDVLFGHPKHYYIADRQGMRLERSTERFFEFGQVAFRSDMRVDGKLALADGFRKLTGIIHN